MAQKKTKRSTKKILFIRVEETLFDALEEAAKRYNDENPGMKATRIDIARMVLTRGLVKS